MMLGEWFGGVRLRALPWSRFRREFLLEREKFEHAAICERLRVDRNGSTLAILLIRLDVTQASRAGLRFLSRLLESRLRITDSAGKLADGRVGVLLPDTHREGAEKVAADLLDAYPEGERPEVTIVVYPDDAHSHRNVRHTNDAPGEDQPVPVGPVADAMFARRHPRWKRAIDIAGASTGLLFAAPVIAMAALAIRMTSPGDVFFCQQREGIGGRKFKIFKLRTMRPDAEAQKAELRRFSEQDGPAFKMTHDPRVTRVGAFLRKSSIDELPQLWNVLIGDMSLVGPRPLPVEESRRCQPWQRQRLHVTPGMTCIWQIWGRNVVPFEEWIRMDLRYIRRQSLWYDLFLLLQTAPAVFASKGPR